MYLIFDFKMAEDGIIQPPEDIATKTIVEKTASFLSRNKMDKSEIMPSDVRYNFLRSLAYLSFGNKSQLKARAQPPPVFNTPNTQILSLPNFLQYKSAEYTDAIQKGFLQRIQLDDPIKERKWLEQGERAMIDWHDATSKPFAMKEVQELLPPQGPDPKRQKLEVSLLVPETQFLAQHQGLSSLTVSFPNRQAVVIKVSSLSANVASLKQIIAEVIQIPADKHKLSGKSGVLNMTLAHYNVRDGDILTLSL